MMIANIKFEKVDKFETKLQTTQERYFTVFEKKLQSYAYDPTNPSGIIEIYLGQVPDIRCGLNESLKVICGNQFLGNEVTLEKYF
jgi:hypothetical protein